MARARGANAIMAVAFNTGAYGAIPGGDWIKAAFVSTNLGEEQGLIESDLLGYGRAPLPPSKDVINNDGDLVVPVDLRNFGYWLRALLGSPTSEQGTPALGSLTFSEQPVAGGAITLDGVAFSFVAGAPASATEIQIGGTLADTLRNAVLALNANTDAAVSAASYALNLTGTAIQVVHDALGVGGNAFALAADADSKATPSGATLIGGSAVGPYRHVFESGALVLPDLCVEIGKPDVPSYGLNYGVCLNTITIDLARSGHLSATLGVIAQGEDARKVPSSGNPTEQAIERFSQFSGAIERSGVPLGEVVTSNFSFSNNLDKVEVIRRDGRIAGADPGPMAGNGNVVVRFKDTMLLDIAHSGEPVDISWSWEISPTKTLKLTLHSVFLPKPRLPISGPGGVQATFNYQAAAVPGTGKFLTATLVNDVPGATYGAS